MNHTISGVEIFQAEGRRRVALSLVLFLALALSLFWPTTHTLIAEWGNMDRLTYTHGWLIAGIALWLMLRASVDIPRRRIGVAWRALPVLALMSLLWLVLFRAGIEVGHQALLPVLLWLALYAALGRAAAIALAFPVAFMYFAIPVWSLLNGVLQQLTVVAMRVLLPLGGISAYFDGNTVHIASGIFDIAGGCSGLHFFIVAIAVAALNGELNRDPLKVRMIALSLAAVLAIAANWLRVFTIIVAGYLTDMQHFLVRVDHYYFGWAVFAVAMCVFFFIARRFPVRERARDPVADSRQQAGLMFKAGLVATGVALSVGPAWAFVQSTMTPVEATKSATDDSMSMQDTAWQPVFIGADVIERDRLMDGAQGVHVYIAEYRTQRQGKELIGYRNSIIGSEDAVILRRTKVHTRDGAVMEWVLRQSDNAVALLWYVYEVGELRYIRPVAAQISYGIQSLIGTPRARVIALRAQCALDCDAERAMLNRVFDARGRFEQGEN